jgi:serine phosphatase RsbU (regulator of sigma subunit)
MPIGYYIAGGKPFTTHQFNLSPMDTIYMLSDGYVDQFGGPDNTKFLMANFKRLLLNLQHDSLCEQKKILSQTIQDFMGTQKQVDDILILGFKI